MVEIAENNENGSLLLGLVFAVVGQEDKDEDERLFREWAGSESSESSRGSTDWQISEAARSPRTSKHARMSQWEID
jgi:hypothetical protein